MSNEPWVIRLGSQLMAHSSKRRNYEKNIF